MRTVIRVCSICILIMNLPFVILAQTIGVKDAIKIDKEISSESTINVKSITNNSDIDIQIQLNAKEKFNVVVTYEDGRIETKSGEYGHVKIDVSPQQKIELSANRIEKVIAYKVTGGLNSNQPITLWSAKQTTMEWNRLGMNKRTEEDAQNKEVVTKPDVKERQNVESQHNTKKLIEKKKNRVSGEELIKRFNKWIDNNHPDYSQTSINQYIKEIEDYIDSMEIVDNRSQYIDDNNLEEYIKNQQNSNSQYRNSVSELSEEFLSLYKDSNIDCAFNYQDSIDNILYERVDMRESALDKLEDRVSGGENDVLWNVFKPYQQYLIAIVVVIISITILVIIRHRRKKRSAISSSEIANTTLKNDTPAIVVRNRTAPVLKKQSLESVIDNPAYFKIESKDFCDDSAVSVIYLKNSCVKEIYNMYAEDLRNPNNPKEDGCMVLGRWVYNEQTGRYSVSLEEVVRPGDDAVFKEYELNFGGKIKLKVAEKLRKLRRDTDLQYDLTCWVHSHPGLGVFFSNSDTSVQMQLKHASHPKMLTAIVVDILTPKQDFGIFTFKNDSTINSKKELNKLYSLEDLYKWAIESDRDMYRPDDHYNVLSGANCLYEGCKAIQLSNGAIIDISAYTFEKQTGLVGWTHGYTVQKEDGNTFIINIVSSAKVVPDNDLLGCLIVGTHCSIPSIKRVIVDNINDIKFVIFYSVKDDTITTIPVMDMQLCTDDKYYSEDNFEKLKIWTRRKR